MAMMARSGVPFVVFPGNAGWDAWHLFSNRLERPLGFVYGDK